jgi:predicted RNase H-like HicB family nuclease
VSKVLARRKSVSPRLIVAEPILTVLVAPDDGEYTAYCPELVVATSRRTPEAAVKELLELLREYAEDYKTDLETFARSPNRAHHLPYIERIVMCRSEWERRQLVAVKYGDVHL